AAELVEPPRDGAVQDDLVEIALHAVGAGAARIGDADRIVLRAEIGIDDPLRAGPRRLAPFFRGVAERHEPRDRQFAPFGRIPGARQLLEIVLPLAADIAVRR